MDYRINLHAISRTTTHIAPISDMAVSGLKCGLISCTGSVSKASRVSVIEGGVPRADDERSSGMLYHDDRHRRSW